MTVAFVLPRADGCWIAADRRTNGTFYTDHAEKWQPYGKWHAAAAGSVRLRNLFPMLDWTSIETIVTSLKEAISDDNWTSSVTDGCPGSYEFEMLVASPSEAWYIDGSFAYVNIPRDQPYAIGSGGGFALGACHVLLDSVSDAHLCKRMLTNCIGAACHYDTGCGGIPFVEHLKS